jgi:hypothetical protein
MEFAICEGCWKRTLDPKLSIEGDKTLCPECAEAEKCYWETYYHNQKMNEELMRRADESEQT